MAITNFIPTVWTENLSQQIAHQYISAANCNRDYEGEIREKGSSVKICGLNPIVISDYQKNMDISAPDVLSDTACELVIDQAKYFNFAIDDIDRVQASPKLMDLALKNAADALANEADAYIMKMCVENTETTFIQDGETSRSNMLEIFFRARTFLAERKVADPNEIIFEVSPLIAQYIMQSQLDLGMTNETMEKGCIGNIAGCKVFVSNNIYMTENGPDMYYHCIARSKRAVAFAEQLSEVEAYRPESRFADAVKGLHLYGAKIVFPDEMLIMKISA